VFISYARSDGCAIAADLRERLEAEGIRLWQDVIGMEGGRDWWLQITDALDHVEFMTLVITPNALESDTVLKEWRYARQEGVCIYPIKGKPDLDFATVPRWMRDKHFYDLANDLQWQKLLNDLNTRCEVPRVPFMVPDLPADFVPRPEEFDQLLANLCNREDEEALAITTALRGAGGYGKTTLAKALCHHEAVQETYDDGILWVTLGEKPGDLVGRLADLVETLSEERPSFSDVNAASTRLRELLADRDVLIVLDDVWDSTHLTPFMQNTGRGALLITTRNFDTLPPDTRRVDVDAMRGDEAVALLGARLSEVDQPSLRQLSKRLGEWPLLLTIANGVLRDRIDRLGQDAGVALGWVNTALDRRGLTAFDARNPQAREQAVNKTLSVSLGLLEATERERYGELAVFPEDVEIPLVTLAKLWSATLDDFDTETLCERFDRLSLLQRFDPNRRVISLHDVVRQYLIGEQGDGLPAVHDALLAVHGPSRINQSSSHSSIDWAELPRDEPYMWDHLAYHLKACGRADELIATAKNLRYLAAKTVARSAWAVEQDLLEAEKTCINDSVLRLLRRKFVQTGHVLDGSKDRNVAEVTLYCWLSHEKELAPLTDVLVEGLQRPFIAPLHPLPDLCGSILVRTLTGHTDLVVDCAISGDGKLIVSASLDRTARVWDSTSGELLHTLTGHPDAVLGCAISSDGRLIVTASSDETVKVWDSLTGELMHTLTGHTGGASSCAISDDGGLIVSVAGDHTVKVWDTASWTLMHTLIGHTHFVRDCAITGDGKLIVSASSDDTVKVWDTASGKLMHTLTGHTLSVYGCAISDDGRLIVSAAGDHTIRVWDGASGDLVHTLTGHADSVEGCAITGDGTLIASASLDHTLKLWDASGTLVRTLTGHPNRVMDCAISGDGRLIVSASLDKTVKVWDSSSREVMSEVNGHTGEVLDCAISGDGRLIASAATDQTVKVWDSVSGNLVRTFKHLDWVNGCAISAYGRLIVSASSDRTVKVWDCASGKLMRTLIGHADKVNGCAISTDARLIVSASDDQTVKVWDSARGKLIRTLIGHTDNVSDCAISGDGRLIVSASFDETVKVWDCASGELLHTLTGHAYWVQRCAISSDGRLIVSSSFQGKVKVWDSANGELLHTLTGHKIETGGCAISGDGRLIVSVAGDQPVRVWDSMSGKCLATLHVEARLSRCAIHDNGDRIVAGGGRSLCFLRLVR
jgi:WD40 repeat protein